LELGRSLLWYPLVGLLIGALLLVVHHVTAGIPPGVRASLLLVMWVLLSGAMHLDGLADTADAWAGGHGDRERTLGIMKDPRCGPMGVTVVVLLLLVKFASLSALIEVKNSAARTLVLAPFLGRAALTALFFSTPYVRSSGVGLALSAQAPRGPAAAIAACACAAVALVAGREGLWALVAAIGTFVLLRASAMRRIGGITGDVAGALVELLEAVVLTTSAIGAA